MLLDKYYSLEHEKFLFSRLQGSNFAKEMADDFNPIHDQDAKRFCVPGDLMFSLVLVNYGLSQHMRFTFSGMVGEGIPLSFQENENGSLINIIDENDKKYLSIERSGEISNDEKLILALTRSYVEFSGHTFPHILVPLMSEKGSMINTERPFVVYESMEINLQRLDIDNLQLELTSSNFNVNGKRGDVCLEFCLLASGEIIGRGEKNMVLSGLRKFDKRKLDHLVESYTKRKQEYANQACHGRSVSTPPVNNLKPEIT